MARLERIVVVGEALVDLVIDADTSVVATLGGAPFNVARAAGRLGAPVAFVGAVSTDRFGTRMMEQLRTDGVDTAAVSRVDVPTTLAAAEVDEDGTASYRFYLDGTSAPVLDWLPPVGPSDLVVTGGLALVLEPMATAVDGLVGGAAPLLVDVNCRPRVIGDPVAYRRRVASIVAGSRVVKVSDEDLGVLAPGVEPMTAAADLLELGPDVVLVTAGGAGVTVLGAGGHRFVPVVAVDVVDTIGAGDSFVGAFAAWWLATGRDVDAFGDLDSVEAAVRAANVAAAVTCSRTGADPPRRHDLPADWS